MTTTTPARSLDGLDDAVAEMVERASSKLPPKAFFERVQELIGESGDLLTQEAAALLVLAEIDMAPPPDEIAPEYAKVLAPDELEPGLDGVLVEGELLGVEPTRSFTRRDGSTGFVTDARVRGEKGVYHITMWDEHIQALIDAAPGVQVRFDGLYTKERDGRIELHTGRDAAVTLRPSTP